MLEMLAGVVDKIGQRLKTRENIARNFSRGCGQNRPIEDKDGAGREKYC